MLADGKGHIGMLHHDMWAIVRRSYSFHHTGHGISHFCFAQDKLSIIHHVVVGKLSLLIHFNS